MTTTTLEQDAVEVLTPVAEYGLGLLFPAIPAPVWVAIFAGIKSGKLTTAAFEAFLAEHGLKTYDAPTDYPDAPPQTQTSSNLEITQQT
jgi:hypothetical protein